MHNVVGAGRVSTKLEITVLNQGRVSASAFPAVAEISRTGARGRPRGARGSLTNRPPLGLRIPHIVRRVTRGHLPGCVRQQSSYTVLQQNKHSSSMEIMFKSTVIRSTATSIHIHTKTLQLFVILLHTTRDLSGCASTIHGLRNLGPTVIAVSMRSSS